MGDAEHYNSIARALAANYDSPSEPPILPISHSRPTTSPLWSRRSLDSPSTRPRTKTSRYLQTAEKYNRKALRLWSNLSPLQKSALLLFTLTSFTLTLLILLYHEKLFAFLAPAAKTWRDLPAGWLILWITTIFISFPPMIGYSTCVTIAGFVFGMRKAWMIMASATVVGSTASFVVSRTVLKKYVSRMTEKNARFAALSLVLKHDGLKLLVMIRLCPLPYSFANGAISTIPTVGWKEFAVATALASPKLLVQVFVGARLGDLAENGDTMDLKTKVVSYLGAIGGMAVGGLTGYLIYARTVARAKELEAGEGGGDTRRRRSSSSSVGGEYLDDDDEERDEREDDALSLHTTAYEDDLDIGYRDEFTDDEDAVERDPFDAGDGPEYEETTSQTGKQ
ncbi:hypothetical protein AC578_10864 [Pseudocercospora eumusae]|uniref:Golgi apparatus membrane protein TVP38 n=1 Tax=Pseudocercospora eumusae TaxID=321146 RepID=A0A139H8S6_9PEZI|nr:hypothetical protein AC578_10864 [Pseudocercospora eumusae]